MIHTNLGNLENLENMSFTGNLEKSSNTLGKLGEFIK